MSKIKDFKDLIAWQLARKLVKEIYSLSKVFPNEELYCLTNQMRKAAISVPSNIAEGFSRRGSKDYANFLSIALGSLLELETQVILSMDLEYIKQAECDSIMLRIVELKKVLYGLRKSIQSL